jgi:hypothetical protein
LARSTTAAKEQLALEEDTLKDRISKSRIGLLGMTALVVLSVVAAASDLAAQFQAPGELGALAPTNIARPRPKAPFDLTGAWLHAQGDENGERYLPPATGFKFTPAAQAHFEAAQKAIKEGKVYRNDIGLCWPSGVPIMMTRVWPVSMIQLPTSIFMISELMNSLRVVYMDGRKHTDPEIAVRSFNGESIGHWEGDALVIDTTNFVADHHWVNDQAGIPASDDFHFVERITMSADGKTLTSQNTLIDPKGWEGEWKATKTFRRVDDRDIAEVECLPDLNVHMPSVHSQDNVR